MSDKIIAGVGIVAGAMGFFPILMLITNTAGEHDLARAIGNVFCNLMGW